MGFSGSVGGGGATERGGGGGARGTADPAVEATCFAASVGADLTMGCMGVVGADCPGRGWTVGLGLDTVAPAGLFCGIC